MPERAGGLDEPDVYEEGSRWHLQGKLSFSYAGLLSMFYIFFVFKAFQTN